MSGGSPVEFEELVRPHVDALYRTALRMTGEGASAEDLVQDCFLKAWKNLDRFERGTNFKAWIFTILTNSYINDYRRRSRAPAMVTDFAESEPAAGLEVPPLTAQDVGRLGERLGDRAKKALEKVPGEFRIVFLLSTIEEMSYRDIAAMLGIPIGTVMSRLFRARRMLREELADFARQEGILRGGLG
ncbi:MAG TPA: sigma-70 family RNA polymerase sigma factor [Planctomycetota bacterium]|nr:sigma-70 family RNA polymerase sigma factor [Planctomycetota bacterium]